MWGLRRRGSRADARAIKTTRECDECGQSVKPPLKSQYYLQDILWCLQGLDKDKTGRVGPGGSRGSGRDKGLKWRKGRERIRGRGGVSAISPLSFLHPKPLPQPAYHPLISLLHTLTLPVIVLFPFHFSSRLLLLFSPHLTLLYSPPLSFLSPGTTTASVNTSRV